MDLSNRLEITRFSSALLLVLSCSNFVLKDGGSKEGSVVSKFIDFANELFLVFSVFSGVCYVFEVVLEVT